jgi:hypothetical protein
LLDRFQFREEFLNRLAHNDSGIQQTSLELTTCGYGILGV